MIVKWGAYAHGASDVQYAITKSKIRGQTGRSFIRVERWVITGNVRAANEAAMKTAEAALETAYASGGKDLTVFYNDGTTETVSKIVTANTINGTRVDKFDWIGGGPQGAMMQGVNRRTFRVEISAEFIDTEDSENIIFWQQSIVELATGGADFVVQRSLTGACQKQTTAAYTPYKAIQKGMAIGKSSYPSFPDPYWTGSLKPEPFRREMVTPKRFGANANMEFPITWEYHFEDAGGLSVTPPLWS